MGTPGQGVHDWGNSLHAILEPRDIENGYLSDDFILAMWREGDKLDGGEGSVGGGGSNLAGGSGSPVYDEHGNFLGTDNGGLQGVIIVMKRDDFVQGMDHDEALSLSTDLDENDKDAEIKLYYHYKDLINRPDWDGFVTIEEGIAWAKSHIGASDNPSPDNTLYLDASKLNFGKLSVSNIGLNEGEKGNVDLLDYVILYSRSSRSTTYALGNTQIQLLDSKNGIIKLFSDVYDWDYHNAFVYGKPQGKRDKLLYYERWRAGVNDTHGFPIIIYGTGKIRVK